jgi:hypothetical protein
MSEDNSAIMGRFLAAIESMDNALDRWRSGQQDQAISEAELQRRASDALAHVDVFRNIDELAAILAPIRLELVAAL